MIRLRQRNTLWLAMLTIMAALALIGGVQALPIVQLLILAGLGGAWIASLVNMESRRAATLVDAIQQRSPAARSRVTPEAREAAQRAAQRGIDPSPELALIDVGLVVTGPTAEGRVMRRSRGITKDDENVRPFITLQVDPSEADRTTRLRFEIIDHNGREQYIHEMNVYLRDGELSILADHQLPLLGNPQVEGLGDWDLRVFLEGKLMGMHTFSLGPTEEERRSRLSGDARARRYVIPSAQQQDSEVPLSLEDLLRDQDQGHSRNR